MPLWTYPPKPCAGYSLRHSHPCRDAFHTPGNPIRGHSNPLSTGSDSRKDCRSGSTGRRYPLSAVRRRAVPSCTQVGGKTHSNLHRKSTLQVCDSEAKVLIGAVKIAQRFLQRHAVCFGKPGCILALLEIGEELTRLDVSQRMMVRFPFITPDRKEVVKHETDTAERAVD